jgi:hypothetical protein
MKKVWVVTVGYESDIAGIFDNESAARECYLYNRRFDGTTMIEEYPVASVFIAMD